MNIQSSSGTWNSHDENVVAPWAGLTTLYHITNDFNTSRGYYHMRDAQHKDITSSLSTNTAGLIHAAVVRLSTTGDVL